MGPRTCAAIATMAWGFTYIIASQLLPHNPTLVGAVRALGAAIALLLFSRQLPPTSWWPKIIVLGTLNGGLFFGFLFIGVMRLTGGVAAVVQALAPLCAVLLGWAILRIAPTWPKIVGIVLGVLGVSLVVLKGSVAIDAVGVLACFGSTLSVALGGVMANKWGKAPIPIIALTGWQLLVAGIELGLVGLVIGAIPPPVALSATNIVALVILSIVITAIPYALWFKAIDEIGAVAAAPFFLLVPVTAFVLDAIFRGIVPTVLQVVGTLVVIAALLTSQWRPKVSQTAASTGID